MKEKPESVFVAVLAGGMSTHASITVLASWLPVWSADPKIPFEFKFWVQAGTAPQELARNMIIERFLGSGCDVLLMIDDDMIVDGTLINLLATAEYDIAAPLQYMWHDLDPDTKQYSPHVTPCAFNFDTTQPEGKQLRPCYPTDGNSASYVQAVGSGVMAIRRRVLLDRRMLLEKGMSPPAFFSNIYRKNGTRLRGLDIDFCRRANNLNYKILVDWRVQVGHYKKTDLNAVDLYAKSSFFEGFQKGQEHAIRVGQEGSREEGGPRRGVGRHPGGRKLAPVEMDSAAEKDAAGTVDTDAPGQVCQRSAHG